MKFVQFIKPYILSLGFLITAIAFANTPSPTPTGPNLFGTITFTPILSIDRTTLTLNTTSYNSPQTSSTVTIGLTFMLHSTKENYEIVFDQSSFTMNYKGIKEPLVIVGKVCNQKPFSLSSSLTKVFLPCVLNPKINSSDGLAQVNNLISFQLKTFRNAGNIPVGHYVGRILLHLKVVV